ncbi:hypothetical protein [Microbacterium sp.]|uniref:hypothetical protein n=1 Tax=Microbacterium sp. TaxID=51671 RepID=UPI003A8A11B4
MTGTAEQALALRAAHEQLVAALATMDELQGQARRLQTATAWQSRAAEHYRASAEHWCTEWSRVRSVLPYAADEVDALARRLWAEASVPL